MTRASAACLGLTLLSGLHAACGGDLPTEPEPERGRLRGRVVAVGPVEPSPLELRISSGAGTLTGDISADGHFSLRFDPEDLTGQVTVTIAESAGSPRRFHPAYFPFLLEEAPEFIDVLLLPKHWTVQEGIHAGETVDISINAAVSAPPRAQPGYFWSTLGSSSFGVTVAVWEDDDRPVPVVLIDHQAATNPITPEDSTHFWAVLNRMERVFGRDLFVPRSAEEVGMIPGSRSHFHDGAILIHVEATSSSGGTFRGDSASWEWTSTATSTWDTPPPSRFGAVGRPIRAGFNRHSQETFRDRENPSREYTITHEIMHAMGFGHSCFIPSTMAYGCGDAGLSASPTAHDVAYWELRRRVHQLSEDHDTRFGWLPALFGERALTLGLDPVPSLKEWDRGF